LVLAATIGLLVLLVGLAWWWFHPPFRHTPDVVYARRSGTALTIDVFQPRSPNGAGVLLMVSGSWKSSYDAINPVVFAPLLRRGYTVFAVTHGSQPKFSVPEIAEDILRSVRFVRHHAREYGVDPGRLGITGGSSGGHLSLVVGTTGAPGQPDAKDPVDRESSAVQAVACFYPVTDLLNLGKSTENLNDGGPPKSFRKSFGPQAETIEGWKVVGGALSPIDHISSNMPPTFIIHGGADTLVPLDQSERFVERARQAGREVKLLVRPGKKHGWPTMILDIRLFADWFDEHLHASR
jgi:acetyl esterase/lipase